MSAGPATTAFPSDPELFQIYWEGYAAVREGKPASGNPYSSGTPQNAAWAQGFGAAVSAIQSSSGYDEHYDENFRDGYFAALQGKSSDANPFLVAEVASWQRGFEAGSAAVGTGGGKPAYKSKLILLGLIMIAINAVDYFTGFLPQTGWTLPAMGVASGVLVIALRYVTDQPVNPVINIRKVEPSLKAASLLTNGKVAK